MKQKRIVVVNDFSGFGRCSLTVSLPIISAMKIQCSALPTAVLSNHTGYDDYFFDDYTDKMKNYYSKWEKLGLRFDGIYTGFLGSVRQVEIINDFIHKFKTENTLVIVDPVMGDNGRTYDTLTKELCIKIRELLPIADVITPNITEACILSGTPYGGEAPDDELVKEVLKKLYTFGCKSVVLTGVRRKDMLLNFVYDGKNTDTVSSEITGQERAGTGDVFASVLAGAMMNGDTLKVAVKKAADFTANAVGLSEKMNIPTQDGICFEEILSTIIPDTHRH